MAAYIAATLLPLVIVAIWHADAGRPLTEFGTGLALTATAMLFMQVLSSGRFELLSGKVGIDRTMGFHRVAALAVLAFAVLHPLSYFGYTFAVDPEAAWSRLTGMLASPRLRSGVVALAGLCMLVGLAALRSHPFVRYEYWRASHGLLAIAVTGLTFHHAMTVGAYSAGTPLGYLWLGNAALAAGALLVVYVVRPWRMWRDEWRIESARRLSDDVVELALQAHGPSRFHFRGGQFIWMTLAPNRPPFHDHPFSISSSPADLPRLRLIVREAGDCTRTFLNKAPGTRVAIDGPHGSFVLPSNGSPVVLIAGGVGIAPMLGILEGAASSGDTRRFRLLYAARHPNGMAALERLRDLQSRLNLEITCLTDEPAQEPDLLTGPICDAHISKLLAGSMPSDAVAFVCGPARLMEIATDGLLAAGVPASNIHYERFDYAAGRGRLDRHRRNQSLAIFLFLLIAIGAFVMR